MSLETTFESIAESLKAIVTHMTTVQSATAVLGAPEATTERKTRTKKADAAPNEAPQPTAAPTTEPAATPAPTTPAASTVSAGKPWADVLAKIVEVNKSELPTAGRKGVENILAKFFGADVVGKKVPSLEAIGRNDEVFAFASSLLVPPAVAEAADLGL